MNATQHRLVDQWFAQLGQGVIDDSMTRQIAQLTDQWGGFGRLAHWISLPADAKESVEPVSNIALAMQNTRNWVVNQIGEVSLAFNALLGNGGSTLAWNVRSSQAARATPLLSLNTSVMQAGIEQQIELAIIKIDDQTCRVDIGVYPDDGSLALDNRQVTLVIGDDERKASTNVYGKVTFYNVPLKSLEQVFVSVAPPLSGVADQ